VRGGVATVQFQRFAQRRFRFRHTPEAGKRRTEIRLRLKMRRVNGDGMAQSAGRLLDASEPEERVAELDLCGDFPSDSLGGAGCRGRSAKQAAVLVLAAAPARTAIVTTRGLGPIRGRRMS